MLQFVSSQEEKIYFGPAKITEHMRSKGEIKISNAHLRKKVPKDFFFIDYQLGCGEEITLAEAKFPEHFYL